MTVGGQLASPASSAYRIPDWPFFFSARRWTRRWYCDPRYRRWHGEPRSRRQNNNHGCYWRTEWIYWQGTLGSVQGKGELAPKAGCHMPGDDVCLDRKSTAIRWNSSIAYHRRYIHVSSRDKGAGAVDRDSLRAIDHIFSEWYEISLAFASLNWGQV